VFLNRVALPEAERNAKAADAAASKAVELLKILNHELENRKFLVGNALTIADLNVGHVVAWGTMLGIDVSCAPNVLQWFGRVRERPGFRTLMS
jgi:glutathione S-transferase